MQQQFQHPAQQGRDQTAGWRDGNGFLVCLIRITLLMVNGVRGARSKAKNRKAHISNKPSNKAHRKAKSHRKGLRAGSRSGSRVLCCTRL